MRNGQKEQKENPDNASGQRRQKAATQKSDGCTTEQAPDGGETTNTGTPHERAREAAESEPGEAPSERKTTTTEQEETNSRLRTTPAERPSWDPQAAANSETSSPRERAEEAATRSTPRAAPETTTQEEGNEPTNSETKPSAGNSRLPTTPTRQPAPTAPTADKAAARPGNEDTDERQRTTDARGTKDDTKEKRGAATGAGRGNQTKTGGQDSETARTSDGQEHADKPRDKPHEQATGPTRQGSDNKARVTERAKAKTGTGWEPDTATRERAGISPSTAPIQGRLF